MGIFSRVFGSRAKYNDSQIVSHAMTALSNDPMVSDTSALEVTSKQGIISVSGAVSKRQEKDRIEGVIRSALTAKGLKHERIINDIRVSGGGNGS